MKLRILLAAALASASVQHVAAQALVATAPPAPAPTTFGITIEIDPDDGRIINRVPYRSDPTALLALPRLSAPVRRVLPDGGVLMELSGPSSHAVAVIAPDGSIHYGCTDAGHFHEVPASTPTTGDRK